MVNANRTPVRFVDSHPFPASKRERELNRAEARSHAATVSHPKHRKQTAEQVKEEDQNLVVPAVISDPPSSEEKPSLSTPTLKVTLLPQEPSQESARPWQKFNQRDQPYHRYRVVTAKSGKVTNREAYVGRKRDAVKRSEDERQVASTGNSIPLYKGNTDPFNSTVVPVSALEHLLLQQARAQSMQNTWPSEIALRHNHGALTAESLKKMPPFISDKASSHAIIAHAYYSSGSRQRIRGHPYEESLAAGEKHKFQALRSLQESIDEQRRTGDPIRLKRIYEACCWLAAAEMPNGNIHAAVVHLAASKRIIDTMGGWSAIGRMEKEILLGAVVNLAAGLRARPVMEIGDFDPGPWRARQWSPELKDFSTLYEGLKLAFPEMPSVPSPKPTSVTPRLRAIFNDMKELLAIEDLKFKYATSKTSGATQIFRWSHARKVSLRARTLHYWCDLNEAAKREGTPTLTLRVPVRVGMTLPSPLALNYEFALCAAMRTFDRCIFEEHYQPAGVFRESKRYHMELTAVMEAIRPAADDFSLVRDDHTYDVLWIYSVGAYVEDVFMRPELERKGDPVPSQDRFFSMRFSYLVATNLEFGTFEDVTKLLRENYLYYPRLQDASLRKLIQF
ncbi:hypothetical protein CLCR_06888 [Cladophialophora carrionii]|uniref:Uncharacterized protein n=1 Tax=Cladophialophora carrionii TaxID=86049 RepID=A0A1C1CPG2_9EURO|nr:hypothetical protein CLCR_06888 [Cladophialophora carrionii]